ncbi:MAG: ABC transporter permease [Candidatus Bipolaricaulia bacterium]
MSTSTSEKTWVRHLRPSVNLVLTIFGAFVVGGLLLWSLGIDPIEAYRMLFVRGLGTNLGVTETLIKMTPLLMVSAGLLIALSAGVWNIGLDGQFLIGAIFVGVTAPAVNAALPLVPSLLILGLIGFLGGATWAIIPAVLKIRYGLNEIITTIMMNFVAINLTAWLVKGPFKDRSVIPPQTPVIPLEDRLPAVWGRVHIGLIVGAVVVIAVYLLMRNTTVGWKMSVVGKSVKAAVHAGIPVARITTIAFLLSAGLAGLAGANDVLSVKGMFQGEWNPAYGFTAFALVFLARFNAVLIIVLAYFFSFLILGGELISRPLRIPVFFVEVLEGLMLILFAASEYLERRRTRRRRPI